MTISFIKKADKTSSSDEVETRQKVKKVINKIELKRDEGIKEISRKFGTPIPKPFPKGTR